MCLWQLYGYCVVLHSKNEHNLWRLSFYFKLNMLEICILHIMRKNRHNCSKNKDLSNSVSVWWLNFFELEFSEFFCHANSNSTITWWMAISFQLLYLNDPKLKVKYFFMTIVYFTQTRKNLLWSPPNQEKVSNHYAGGVYVIFMYKVHGLHFILRQWGPSKWLDII